MPEGMITVADETTIRRRVPVKALKKSRRPASKKKELTETQLIALCHEMLSADKTGNGLYEQVMHLCERHYPPGIAAEMRHLNKIVLRNYAKIAATPAQTIAGVKAKADAIIHYHNNEPDEDRLAEWSVLLDVVRLQETLATAAPLPASDRETFRVASKFEPREALDLDVVALGQEYAALKAASDAGYEAVESSGSGMSAFDAEDRPRQDRMNEIESKVDAMRPHTMAGFAAKALIAHRQLMLFHSSRDDGIDSSVVTAVELCNDLMAQARARQQTPGEGMPSVGHADALLIKLCADHIANHRAFNTDESGLDPDDNPLWSAYLETYHALESTPATTLAGLIAKARVAKVEARMSDGEDIPEEASWWTNGIVDDLLNLDLQVTKTTSGITEIHHLALEMGRLDREANEADNLFTDEGVAVSSVLTEQIDKAAFSIMKMEPQTLVDVMGKLMATIGGIDPMGAHLDDFPALREIEATVRTSIEDCLVALQAMTGQNLADMGGSYFMTRRMKGLSR